MVNEKHKHNFLDLTERFLIERGSPAPMVEIIETISKGRTYVPTQHQLSSWMARDKRFKTKRTVDKFQGSMVVFDLTTRYVDGN